MTNQPDRNIRRLMRLARFGFENDLSRLMDKEPIGRAELARRYGSSLAYISALLNGESNNYQLETMAKVAAALGAVLEIRIAAEGEFVRVVDKTIATHVDSWVTKSEVSVTSGSDYALEASASPYSDGLRVSQAPHPAGLTA